MTGSDRVSYAGGFADLDDEVGPLQLPLQGEFPAWLSGALLRTGPAKFNVGSTTVNHWFDGLAMLHRFSFADGAVSYTNRFLRADSYCEAAVKGSLARGEFATDPCRTLFQRVAAVFTPHLTDNCNVNVDVFGGQTVALTETTLPVRFDAETLQTLGHYPASAEVGGMVSIAHPHHDAARGCRFSYVVSFRPQVALPAVRHSRRWLARARRRRDAGRQAGLHAFVRDDRALSRADGVSSRRRSATADAGGRTVHPQLPLDARARPALSRVRQGQRRARGLEDDRSGVRLPSRQRLRGRLRSPHRRHHLRRRRHHRPALSVAFARRRDGQRHRPLDALHRAARR